MKYVFTGVVEHKVFVSHENSVNYNVSPEHRPRSSLHFYRTVLGEFKIHQIRVVVKVIVGQRNNGRLNFPFGSS